MQYYAGIEKVDSIERSKQHQLTKSLWQQLCDMGIKTGDKGRIKALLVSDSCENAEELKAKYQEDFDATLYKNEEEATYLVELETPVSRLSLEAFLELADILMISADETGCKFDGLEIDAEEVRKLNVPWWKFW